MRNAIRIALVLLICACQTLTLGMQQSKPAQVQERALALYTDLVTGKAMLVNADVLQKDALQWLAEITRATDTGNLKAPKRAGLLQIFTPPLNFALAPSVSGAVADYLDMRTGRHLFVQASTPPSTVAEWFKLVNEMNDAQAVNKTIGEYRKSGLLGARFGIADTEITLYRGEIRQVADSISMSMADQRTGRVLVVAGNSAGSDVEKWQSQLREAKTPADLASAVTADHTKGLRAATMFIGECDCKVTIEWK